MIFDESIDDLDVSKEAAREELNQHAVYTARMASIPFGMAALGMVVCCPLAAEFSATNTNIRDC